MNESIDKSPLTRVPDTASKLAHANAVEQDTFEGALHKAASNRLTGERSLRLRDAVRRSTLVESVQWQSSVSRMPSDSSKNHTIALPETVPMALNSNGAAAAAASSADAWPGESSESMNAVALVNELSETLTRIDASSEIPVEGAWEFCVLDTSTGVETLQLRCAVQTGWQLRIQLRDESSQNCEQLVEYLKYSLASRGHMVNSIHIVHEPSTSRA